MKVGCCGFPRGMSKYFQKFELVEVQKTFYSLPKLDTVERWREKAPSNFEFSVKAWQLITHQPRSPTYRKARIAIPEGMENNYGFFMPTEEVFEAWKKTSDVCHALRAKVVVFQCPPSFKQTRENIKNMESFFSAIERRNLIFAWEPRGNWSPALIKKLCEELNLVHCIDPLASELAHESDALYFRLHGLGKRTYYYSYTDKDLERLLQICKDAKVGEIYCLFNNISMEKDATRFQEIARASRSSQVQA